MKLLKHLTITFTSISLFACGGGGGGGGFTPEAGSVCSSGNYTWESVGNAISTSKINYFNGKIYAVSSNNICILSQGNSVWDCSITYQPPYGYSLISSVGAVVDSSSNIYALSGCSNAGCSPQTQLLKYTNTNKTWTTYSSTLPNSLVLQGNLTILNNVIYARADTFNLSTSSWSNPSLCSFDTSMPDNGWSCNADEALTLAGTQFLSGDYMRIAVDNTNNIYFNRLTYANESEAGTYKNPLGTQTRQQIGAPITTSGIIAVDQSLVYVKSACNDNSNTSYTSVAVTSTSSPPSNGSWAQFKTNPSGSSNSQNPVYDITAGDGLAYILSTNGQVYKLDIGN